MAKNRELSSAEKDRLNMLRNWLHARNARCLWQVSVSRIGDIEMWIAEGRLFIVEMYEGGNGFDIFIPASTSGRINVTLDAAARYIHQQAPFADDKGSA